jgi:hypothetical protein
MAFIVALYKIYVNNDCDYALLFIFKRYASVRVDLTALRLIHLIQAERQIRLK